MAVPLAPQDHRARVGEHARLVLGQQRAGDAQVLEARLGRPARPAGRRPVRRRNRRGRGSGRASRARRPPGSRRNSCVASTKSAQQPWPAGTHEAARLPDRHDQRVRIGSAAAMARRVLAQVRGTIEVRARKDVGDTHDGHRGSEARSLAISARVIVSGGRAPSGRRRSCRAAGRACRGSTGPGSRGSGRARTRRAGRARAAGTRRARR